MDSDFTSVCFKLSWLKSLSIIYSVGPACQFVFFPNTTLLDYSRAEVIPFYFPSSMVNDWNALWSALRVPTNQPGCLFRLGIGADCAGAAAAQC